RGAWTHRRGEHNWFVALDCQIKQIGRFLQSICPVRDNDSIDVGLMKQFVHALSDFQHNRVRHAFAAKLSDLLRSNVCDFSELWYCLYKVVNFDYSRGVT